MANKKYGDASSEERPYEMLKVDFDFVNTYQLKVIAGRTFDKNRPSDSTGLLLNESAVKQFGFESNEKAVGEKIWLEVNRGKPNEVIGVIKDYHQQSLQQKYTPLILFMDPDYGWIPSDFYSVRVKTGNMDKTIASVQKLWLAAFPESSFDFFFLDEYYNRQYQQERNFGRIFFLFSSLRKLPLHLVSTSILFHPVALLLPPFGTNWDISKSHHHHQTSSPLNVALRLIKPTSTDLPVHIFTAVSQIHSRL